MLSLQLLAFKELPINVDLKPWGKLWLGKSFKERGELEEEEGKIN